MKERVHSIDALRGIFALLVLFYHCSCWCKPYFCPPAMILNALTLWGIYAVEGFFVISGMSLALAYSSYTFQCKKDWYKFFVRRYIRIVPLYAFLMVFFQHFFQHCGQLLMVFGFKDPLASCLPGGWSIGVEFCLYFSFPLLLILTRNGKTKLLASVGCFLLLFFSVKFKLRYVNPIQHIFFFNAGMLLGITFKKSISKYLYAYCALGLFIFMSFLAPVEQKSCLENYTRLFWALSTVALVFLCSKIEISNFFIRFLGQISYGVYLIHPVFIWKILPGLGLRDSYSVVPLTLICSILSAYFLRRFFETPLQTYLKKILHA